MTDGMVIQLSRDAMMTGLLVAAPVLGIGMVVGLLVSLFQATTQINEQTLAFVPKILAMLGALALFGPWMLHVLVDYTTRVWNLLPVLGGGA
ncbi:MAG: flagellar biosynthesis protein FliQ [Clostridia bacterium]|nr:flagellar biosynthesis protein FliQ [Clostridia bacterium]